MLSGVLPSVYANAIQDNLNVILYPGLIEELVDIIEIADSGLVVRSVVSLVFLHLNNKIK